MNMLRPLFSSLSPRERLLITVFIWALTLLWLSSLTQNLRTVFGNLRVTSMALDGQNETLALAELAELQLQTARQGLDAGKTFSAPQLVGQLDSLAREAGLTFDLSSPMTQETDIFSFHNVRLGIRRAQISDLIQFNQKIRENSPYITLTRFQLLANARDPRYLDATFEVSSFELKESALQ